MRSAQFAPTPAITPALGVAALVLASLNLRAIVTSVSPVLAEVQAATGMTATTAGILTSLPCFIFGMLGLLTPLFTRRIGMIPMLTLAMGLLFVGLCLRATVHSAPAFIWWSAFGLCGIAIANVLIPPFVRTFFPQRTIPMMTTYTVMLGIGTVVSAFVAAPLAAAVGWRMSLGVWAILAFIACCVFLPLWWQHHRQHHFAEAPTDTNHSATTTLQMRQLVTSPKARWLICFFAIQSLNAYAQMGWLAQIIRDQGYSATTAGIMLSVMQFVIIPGGFIAPFLLQHTKQPHVVICSLALLIIPAYLGILWLPSLMWVWVIAITLSNLCFPVALCLIGTSARTAENTQLLSAISQGFGYILAGIGPLLVGVLFTAAGSWEIPVLFLTATVPLLAFAGYQVAQPGYVEDEITPAV